MDINRIMEISRYLIDNGADPNFIGGIYGSALNVAAMRKGPELIRFLTRQGANIRMPDTNGRTPIHFAAYHGIGNLTIPLELGGEVSCYDYRGRSPLHWAAQGGRVRAVEYLLNVLHPTAVNLGDIDGWTPICYAAQYTDNDDTLSVAGESSDILGVIHLLIRSGASLSVQALSGDEAWSPLRIECYSGATMDVIKSLKLPSEQRVVDDEVNIGGCGDGRWCSDCFWTIAGTYFRCTECSGFDLCHKCYPRRDVVSTAHVGHEFEEFQYDPPSESESRSLLQQLNGTTYQDPDSSSEGEWGTWRNRRRIRRRPPYGHSLFYH
ncbi:ankyrin repeat-containing domain protein [Aspergillus pseudonomiae]|uniref:Ankyrin repeat-containing domain protein n=1 Tax=Aspergillus pseudonomiae TaxID=1506151 RepID=A0A5N7CXR6_9EURO|nr:ankyrin repeat-containing domain protein [Aspergillus pseudonomiae]KAE8398985.1 ankyrin repeat-containing domain protein [Aspergillus pseudonomiae]